LGNWLKIGVLIAICLIPLFTVPVFAQEMGLYENELYDFSFYIPMDWRYLENYLLPDGSTFQVILFPEEFDPLVSAFDAPVIFVKYESIPESSIRNLNEQAIERFELERVRLTLPNAKIINSDVKSTPWGWEGTFEVVVNLNVPFVAQGEYREIAKVFYFKNRESYTVGYLSPVAYFDSYDHVYEDVVNSTIINGVVVPEFQEIATVVLAGSIVLVVVFARKFKVMKILNS